MRAIGVGLGAALAGVWAVALCRVAAALVTAPGPARPLRPGPDPGALCYAPPVIAERVPGSGGVELWTLCAGRGGRADLVRVDLDRAIARVWASGLRAGALRGLARHPDGRVAVLAERALYVVRRGRVRDLGDGATGYDRVAPLVRGIAWDGDALQVVWSGCHGCASAELARFDTAPDTAPGPAPWHPAPLVATYDGHDWRFAPLPVPGSRTGERLALVATYRRDGRWRTVFLGYPAGAAPGRDGPVTARLLVGGEGERPVEVQTVRLARRPRMWTEHRLFDGSGGGVFTARDVRRQFVRDGARWRPVAVPAAGRDMRDMDMRDMIVRYDYQRAGSGYEPIVRAWRAVAWQQPDRGVLFGVGPAWFAARRPGLVRVDAPGSAPRRVAGEPFMPQMMFGAGGGDYWLVDPRAGRIARVDRELRRVDPLSWWQRLKARPVVWKILAAGPLGMMAGLWLWASRLPARGEALLRRPRVGIERAVIRLWSGRAPRAPTRAAAPGRALGLGVAVLYVMLLAYHWGELWSGIALL